MDLNEMADTAWKIAEDKGHHENLAAMPLREATMIRLALVHTEVSEAIQHVKRHGISRDYSPKSVELAEIFAEELADILLRVGDLAKSLSVDLDRAVTLKNMKNRRRPRYFGTPQEERTY